MSHSIRRRLLVSAFIFGTLVALGDEPKKSADHTICMGLQCTEGRRVRSEVQIPNQGDEEIPVYEGGCPRGLPVEKEMKTLPRGHAFIGKDRKQVIIDLKDPERDLEDGDVLLSSYDTRFDQSPATQFFDGSGHAALVGTVNGRKFHMDSPFEMSGRCSDYGFRGHGWTVLRLRQYPIGVNTPADLEKMRKEHPEKIEQWQKYRSDVLKRVNQYFEAMRRSPYEYNPDYLNTKVFDKQTRETWRAQLYPKEGKASCPVGAVYCSELPTTGFALADEDVANKLPRGLSILGAINNFEAKILKPELGDKKLDSPEGVAAFDRAWKKLVDDVGAGHGDLVREFRRQEEKVKAAALQLLKLPREMRPTAFALFTSQVPLPVSPTDLYNDIFRENGLFSYVGSYVGSGCYPTEKIVAQGLPNEGKSRRVAESPRDYASGGYGGGAFPHGLAQGAPIDPLLGIGGQPAAPRAIPFGGIDVPRQGVIELGRGFFDREPLPPPPRRSASERRRELEEDIRLFTRFADDAGPEDRRRYQGIVRDMQRELERVRDEERTEERRGRDANQGGEGHGGGDARTQRDRLERELDRAERELRDATPDERRAARLAVEVLRERLRALLIAEPAAQPEGLPTAPMPRPAGQPRPTDPPRNPNVDRVQEPSLPPQDQEQPPPSPVNPLGMLPPIGQPAQPVPPLRRNIDRIQQLPPRRRGFLGNAPIRPRPAPAEALQDRMREDADRLAEELRRLNEMQDRNADLARLLAPMLNERLGDLGGEFGRGLGGGPVGEFGRGLGGGPVGEFGGGLGGGFGRGGFDSYRRRQFLRIMEVDEKDAEPAKSPSLDTEGMIREYNRMIDRLRDVMPPAAQPRR